jgi:PAS domain S-box-containing protein
MLTSLRGKFILIFILITVSTVMISSGYARYQQRRFVLERIREQALVDLDLINTDIRSLQLWIQRDLLVLRDLPNLQALLNATVPSEKNRLFHIVEQEFLNIAAHHQIFQQLRLLDMGGIEVIRANSNGSNLWLTSRNELQDKNDRYYFRKARVLDDGEISISPLDLNMEHGRLQQPIVPVIRYSTPLFDRNKIKQGVLVLNVFGSVFLNLLDRQQNQVRVGENFYLLNQDGYFLYHPDPGKRFGFVLNQDSTFSRHEPEIAEWLGRTERGTVIHKSRATGKKTLYAYIRIPLYFQEDTHPDSTQSAQQNEASWILLTTVDDADLLVGLDEYVRSFLKFTLLLIALCVAVAVFVAWRFSRPIISLAQAASMIQGGDLSSRAQIFSRDDMGKFGQLFNAMAANLENSITSLSRSETKYRQLFENSQDCIFVADNSCRIIELNKAGKDLFGVTKTPLPEGVSLGECQRADRSEVYDIRSQLQATGAVRDVEIVITRLDASQRYCIMTATIRKDEEGLVSGYEGVLRDVTELREQQQKEQRLRRRIQDEIVLAEERERRHMAQVLHEEMAQNLALVNLRLQEAEKQPCLRHEGPGLIPNCAHFELRETRETVKVMINQIRTMIFDLFPRVLEEQGLAAAMDWYGKNFSRKSGVKVNVYGGGNTLGLSESQNVFLFRAYKELLHNSWKHAETAEIVATVQRRGEHVRVTVDDEGKGFDPGRLNELSDGLHGIGLVTIQQWVAAMDGSMQIESEPGKGCRVILDIPINSDGRRQES